MPLDDDFDEIWEELDRDDIEGIQIYFDSDGSVDLFITIDGELVDFGTFDPEEAQMYIWDDLWYWADENDIEFDKDDSYTEA